MRTTFLAALLVFATALVPRPAHADGASPPRGDTGSVTGLELPRFVSLRAEEGKLRRGPGVTHKVDWVYVRAGVPLQVTAEFGNWRRVRDADGVGGWMHGALLSGRRTAIVRDDSAPMRRAPAPNAPVVARVEAGVIGRLLTCRPDWCRLSADHYAGWVARGALWGASPGETRE